MHRWPRRKRPGCFPKPSWTFQSRRGYGRYRKRQACSCEPRFQRLKRCLGQDELVTLKDRNNVDPLHRQHVDIRDVARGKSEVLVDSCTVDDQSVCPRSEEHTSELQSREKLV